MAATIHYSVNPDATGDLKVASDITIAGGAGAAVFTAAQTGNIGVGYRVISSNVDGYISEMTDSTNAIIVDALGAAHGNVAQESLTSISSEYLSFAALEAGCTDANHTNSTDWVSSEYAVNAWSYYDETDGTLDTATVVISTATTNSTYNLNWRTPNGGTESINVQRSEDGVFDTSKYLLRAATTGRLVRAGDSSFSMDGTFIDGIQLDNTEAGSSVANVIEPASGITGLIVDHCIFNSTNGGVGVRCTSSSASATFQNTIIFFDGTRLSTSEGVQVSAGTLVFKHVVINNFDDGIENDGGTITITNGVVFGNGTDFDDGGGTITASYCASDSGFGTNAQTLDDTSDYANEFTDAPNLDYSLVSGGVCVNNGTDAGVTNDIIGAERSQGSGFDIGPHEFPEAGAAGAIMNQLQGSNLGADLFNGTLL